MKTCFVCPRLKEKVCDGLCPYANEVPCVDCPRRKG